MPVPLGRSFTYRVPEELERAVVRGTRVLVDFHGRKVLAVVLGTREPEPDLPPDRIKPVEAVVDTEPVLPEDLLCFLEQVSRYYFAPIGEVLRLALPAVERSARERLKSQGLGLPRRATVGRVETYAIAVEGGESPRLRSGTAALWQTLRNQGECRVRDLLEQVHASRSGLRRLVKLGLARLERRPADPTDRFFVVPVERDRPPALTPAQALAVETILEALTRGKPRAFLLHGVTASGKTEVYLRLVAHALGQGRGAIVLVPEIALTPQLVARFRARLGDEIAVLHSGLSDRARHGMWQRLRQGQVRVAIGARSALFAPVAELGLVCVDEEHDGSFKQEEGVRYHARDMALLRAHQRGAVCVLGSATPSLESEQLTRTGKLIRLRLPARAREASALPTIEIVDLRRVGPGPTGDRRLSLLLHRELERVLELGQQAILFLNRRGFAPYVVCNQCGHFLQCPTCSVALTLHRTSGPRLVCHYCGYETRLGPSCPGCGSGELLLEGAGTERIEDLLARAFPGARIARLDRDVAAGRRSEQVLERMRRKEIDILIGTQMVTKGHDLPGVTLVGVLDADSALSLPDFRAAERTFQLLVQVAGRAGRGSEPGKVMIQTRNPEHPAIFHAARHDVEGFIEQELRDRAELGYPPFARLVLVRVEAVEEARARSVSEKLAQLARAAALPGVRVLGPAPAPLARLRNRYRYHFLVRASDRQTLRQALLPVARATVDRRARVVLDVDPNSML